LSIVAALHHRTTYSYDQPVVLGPQVVRLRPAPHARTRVVSYSLKIEPAGHFINWQQDPHGNWLARLVFPEPTRKFQIVVDLVADLAVVNPFDFFVEDYATHIPFAYPKDLGHELIPYLEIEPAGERLEAFVASIDRKERVSIDFLVELNQRLQQEIRYTVRLEPGVQAPGRDQPADGEQDQTEGQVDARADRFLGVDGVGLEYEHVQQADRQRHGQAAEQDAQEHRPRPPVLDQQQVDGEQLRVQRRDERQREELGAHRRSASIGQHPRAGGLGPVALQPEIPLVCGYTSRDGVRPADPLELG